MFRIYVDDASFICWTQEGTLAWVNFLLDRGQAPKVEYIERKPS